MNILPTILSRSFRKDQLEKLEKWYKTLPQTCETEEDCVPFCTVKFEIRSTGLGDEIYATYNHNKVTSRCCLIIDDDNELINLDEEKSWLNP